MFANIENKKPKNADSRFEKLKIGRPRHLQEARKPIRFEKPRPQSFSVLKFLFRVGKLVFEAIAVVAELLLVRPPLYRQIEPGRFEKIDSGRDAVKHKLF